MPCKAYWLELELELIQTKMVQKPVLRAELYRRAGFIGAVVRQLSRRCTFGEFESLAIDTRRR